MFLAVGMDGNNQILPLAFGVGKTEHGDEWTWFLRHLKDNIGGMEDVVIISDRAASIALAIRTVFPRAHHGICCRHLSMNLNLRSKKAKGQAKVFWKTCKANRMSDFEERMTQLRRMIPSKIRMLEELGYAMWSRVHFPGMRWSIMTSNSAESINALSRYARRLPIVPLVDFFRATLQQWYFERRNEGGNL